jgi:hypothetical protein
MFEEEIKCHDELFLGASWEIGKINWYIQKAQTEMKSLCWIEGEVRLGVKRTDFGKEVGSDEIHWWVFKKEREIKELLKKTETTLISLQKLKEDSLSLKEKYRDNIEPYLDLIKKIKEFTESHKEEIHALYDYVVWLYEKDVLAPCILFTYRVWGATRLSDRSIKITANAIDDDQETVKKCTESALGLRSKHAYTIEDIYSGIQSDIADSIDPEHCTSFPTPDEEDVLIRTSHKILDEFATFFERLRESLRNVILEIEEYNAPTFTKQWNLLERILKRRFGNINRVSKLKSYGNAKPQVFAKMDRDMLREVLSQHCVYDDETNSVKPYVRDSFVLLRRELSFAQELCSPCPNGIGCDRSIGLMNDLSLSGALLLISYQVRCNQAHLGKFEDTDRNHMLMQFAMRVFEIAIAEDQ